MRRILTAITTLSLLTGCSQSNPDGNSAVQPESSPKSGGVLSSLRAKADPAVVAKLREQEYKQKEAQAMQAKAALDAQMATSTTVSGLPQVNQSPFAPPADQVVAGSQVPAAQPQPAGLPFWPFGGNQAPAAPQPPAVASYGGYNVPPPPPGSAGSLVPPPPAVSLSTQAQPLPYGAPPPNPYANPYAQAYQAPQAFESAPGNSRAAGSLFGSGSRSSLDNGDDEGGSYARNKKLASFVPITPTGMESRSAYKQREDLKLLWKGVLSESSLQKAMKDGKLSQELTAIEVGLPAESSKGSFNVSQRQIEVVFKPTSLDKRLSGPVKKAQTDLVQSYYRYLYAYNKFALAQQTVAARKQQVEVAASASEQQRAAADLSQAQNDAEGTKEDMRAAQTELSSVAGPQAARSIIGRVSGVAPSAESLAMAQDANAASQPAEEGGGFLGAMSSMLGLNKTAKKAEVASDAPKPEAKKTAAKKVVAKESSKTASEPVGSVAAGKVRELAAAPKVAAPAAGEQVSFELKNVNVTPRKSVLKVAIRNNGGDNFSFDPEVVSVSEGSHKLSESTVRAEFDTTLVAPNQEVVGTITIFGRPWSDRLSVSLSDGGKTINLRR